MSSQENLFSWLLQLWNFKGHSLRGFLVACNLNNNWCLLSLLVAIFIFLSLSEIKHNRAGYIVRPNKFHLIKCLMTLTLGKKVSRSNAFTHTFVKVFSHRINSFPNTIGICNNQVFLAPYWVFTCILCLLKVPGQISGKKKGYFVIQL